jgi:hypothetical protein
LQTDAGACPFSWSCGVGRLTDAGLVSPELLAKITALAGLRMLTGRLSLMLAALHTQVPKGTVVRRSRFACIRQI